MGLLSDIKAVFWKFIFDAFRNRKKAVKCGGFSYFFICTLSMVEVLAERALIASHT